jgi:hypothetical protein
LCRSVASKAPDVADGEVVDEGRGEVDGEGDA